MTMTETAETAVTTVTKAISQIFDDNPPRVHLESFVGTPHPGSPKTLFSIRIPAKHQAEGLSIVRMQNCDLTQVLQNAKMDHRDKSKFTVPTTAGPCIVKLHFLIFPNRADEIQIDYMYSPQESATISRHHFALCRQVDTEVGNRIHYDTTFQHDINVFASIVHDLVCEFIDRIYFDSIAAGKKPDYLVMTPPL